MNPAPSTYTQEVELAHGDGGLPAALYKPVTAGKHPAIVVSPAGLARGDLDAYRWAGERFANLGYVTLIHAYRAASPYGDADDITRAIDWLSNNPDVDSDRLILFGHSRGGTAALKAAAGDARLKAIVSIAAVIDIAEYVRRVADFAPPVKDVIFQFMGGSPEEIPDSYESTRALSLAKAIRQPVLLIHGTADMRVPLDHSVRMKDALGDAGNSNVELETIAGMGHYLELATRGYQFDQVTEKAKAWLDRVLR